MEIPEAITKRRSIRAFIDKNLSDADVEILIKAACQAPSAGNMQPWGFVVIRDTKTKERLVEAANGQSFIASAPVVVIVCADPARTAPRYGERGINLYCIQDTAAAIENILLTATHNGLGTCWIGAFNEELAAKAIDLSPGLKPIALIPVGYPAQNPQIRRRRPLSEVLHKEKW